MMPRWSWIVIIKFLVLIPALYDKIFLLQSKATSELDFALKNHTETYFLVLSYFSNGIKML